MFNCNNGENEKNKKVFNPDSLVRVKNPHDNRPMYWNATEKRYTY